MTKSKNERTRKPATRRPSPDGDVRPIEELIADPSNRRDHPESNLEMIAVSLKRVGPGRSIVIDETDTILAGNGVARSAVRAGIDKVRIIEASGDELIAVRRRGLTAEQKRDLAIYDNRTNELSTWNPDQLRADLEAGLALEPFFSDVEVADILARSTPAAIPDAEAAPADDPPRDVPIGQFGVIVVCENEAEQERAYNDLAARGYVCRVVNT